ncbi:MAG: aminodeoxychorismate lyase, partial [Flavobacteriales bacterium]|nr:aminodeoxychorismate lyase [Flavobacteriales bacterium]
MLNQYNLFWNSSRKKKADALNLSPIQVSVLASIVQRETPKVD